jgi:hypothetical protein
MERTPIVNTEAHPPSHLTHSREALVPDTRIMLSLSLVNESFIL